MRNKKNWANCELRSRPINIACFNIVQVSLNEENQENGQEEPDPATIIDVYVSLVVGLTIL